MLLYVHSTEPVGLLGTGGDGSLLGTGAQDVHLHFHTAFLLSCCFTSTEARWPIRDGHTAPELCGQEASSSNFVLHPQRL